MGENIVINISSGGWFWLPTVLGIFLFFVAFLLFMYWSLGGEPKEAKIALVLFLMSVLSFVAIIPVRNIYDNSVYQNNEKMAEQQLKPIQEVYNSHRFYLKEQISEPGGWGEIKGSVGGFIFFGGSIYGRVDSGRVLTVVYEDDDALINRHINVHRSMSLPLDQVVIETISAEEHPYFMYPEAEIYKNGHRLELIPKTIHLYLPKGWKIL